MARPSTFPTSRLSTKRGTAGSRERTWNFSLGTTGRMAFGARPGRVSRSTPGPKTRTVSVAPFTTPAWFARFFRYEHHAIPARRASPSRLYKAGKRVPFLGCYALRVLHKPSVQVLRANGIGFRITCLHSQAFGTKTRYVSRLPVWGSRVPPVRTEGLPRHRARESPNSEEARTGVCQDALSSAGFCVRASAPPISRNGARESRLL